MTKEEKRAAMQKAVDDAYYADSMIITLPLKDVIYILNALDKAEIRIKALEDQLIEAHCEELFEYDEEEEDG